MLDIKTSNSIVAEQVLLIIEKNGLRQSALAQNAGFTPQELNDMLHGRRLIRACDVEALIKALKHLGVDANCLFGIKEV